MALVLLESLEGLATITLNRPEAMNALSHDLRAELFDVCQYIAEDFSVRAVIITGTGERAFTAGLDLKELGEQGLGAATDQNPARNPCRALELLDVPVIGAINGVAITGGFELALACDVRIASTNARFADTHARVGIIPGWGLSQKLSRHIGLSRACELALEDSQGSADARLAELRADVAILVTNTPPDELVGRQLTRVRFAAFAAPEYLEGRDSGALSAQSMNWILWTLGDSGELDDSWQRSALRRLVRRPDIVLHTDRHSEALAAVRAGVGAAFLGDAGATGLVRLPFAEPRETAGIWLLTHPDLRRSGRVRAFFDFVAAHLHGGDDSVIV
jgi:enoyl-CoA hydratase